MSTAPHPGRKRAKKHEEEEHENHERWRVSYADMMTLLLVLRPAAAAVAGTHRSSSLALVGPLRTLALPLAELASSLTLLPWPVRSAG